VDAKELTPEHIFKDNKGTLWIRKGREKMKRRQGACMSNVPLLSIAQQILEKYKGHPVCQAKGVCLPVYIATGFHLSHQSDQFIIFRPL
jgi:hypothetical protein